MNWVDITIVTALIVSAVLGLFWGLIRQVAATFGLVLAIFLAGTFYKGLADFLSPPEGGGLIQDHNVANFLAFVLILVGVSLGVGIIASLLRTLLGLLFLGWLDHLLGALLGVFQMALLMAVVIFVATMFPVGDLSTAVRESALAPFVAQVFSFVLAWLPPEFNTVRFLLNMNH